MNKAIYILGGIGIVAGVMSVFLYSSEVPTKPDVVACTLEARVCPNGSAVGRAAPSCEFAACPAVSVALGETVSFGTTNVTPQRVTEDSRCPSEEGVACIWEGVLTVEVKVEDSGREQTSVMSPGSVVATSWGDVLLSSVVPPARTGSIGQSEYRFTFVEDR